MCAPTLVILMSSTADFVFMSHSSSVIPWFLKVTSVSGLNFYWNSKFHCHWHTA